MASVNIMQFNPFTIDVCQGLNCSTLNITLLKEHYPKYFQYRNVMTLYLLDGSQNVIWQKDVSDLFTCVSSTVTTVVDHQTYSEIAVGTFGYFEDMLAIGDFVIIDDFPVEWYEVSEIIDQDHLYTKYPIYRNNLTSPNEYEVWKFEEHFSITATDVSIPAGVFSDGQYTFRVTIVDPTPGGLTYNFDTTIQTSCSNDCCVYDKLADLANVCDPCMDGDTVKDVINTLYMWSLLQSSIGAGACGNNVSQQYISNTLNKFCSSTPCKNCK